MALHQHGVEHIVVGLGAAVLRGAPVTTFDLDVVHRRTPDNVARLLGCLAAIQARYRNDPRGLVPTESHLVGPGHQLLETVYGPLDVLGAVAQGLDYEALLASSSLVDLGAFSTRVLELGAVIDLKRRAGRPKDLAVLPLLESTLRRAR
ncbi:MAG: hypothetical protein HY744_03735 [Deltaproteobacteria bacterium]|nr:hypothetical protein [Deltaproteobacteria bacterium]